MPITEISTHLMATLAFLGKNQWALSLCIIASAFILFVMLFHTRKMRLLGKKVKRLEHELKVARASAVAMGQQILNLEKQLDVSSAVTRQTIASAKSTSYSKNKAVQVSPQPQPVSFDSKKQENETGLEDQQSVYDEARYFLSQGNDVGDVATKCGLSYAEVSLLKALSNPGTVSQQPL
jgi:hypothetical protein